MSVPTHLPSARPLLEITGGRGRVSRAGLVELWAFRSVLVGFLVRDVKVRYKQAVVGIGWALLQPVVAAALFALFLGRLTDIPSEGLPYLLFALAGMVTWTFFSGATTASADSLVANQALLRKIYFPREALPLSAIGVSLADLVPGTVVLLAFALAYGVGPELTWVALPIPLLIALVAAAAVGLALSAINVYYRDVRYALPFLLQLGLFASPVVYPLDVVPEEWRTAYAVLNPVAAAIDGVRRTALHGDWPDPVYTVGGLLWAFVLLVLAFVLFKRVERGFSDRV